MPSEISSTLNAIAFDPCFALLVTIDGPGRVPPPDYIRPNQGPVEWIADNTQKGVSTGAAAVTLHARADFSRHYLEAPQEDVARLLREAAGPWFGGQVTAWQLHRGRYSRPVDAGQMPTCLFSRQPACPAIAGDAFGGSRLECAFLSRLGAAERIAETGSRKVCHVVICLSPNLTDIHASSSVVNFESMGVMPHPVRTAQLHIYEAKRRLPSPDFGGPLHRKAM